MIYLDNAATTKMDERVLEEMLPYLTTEYGNAGTLYEFGRSANSAVQRARNQVALFLHASREQVIFTSGGSEANNLVFGGLKDCLKRIGKTHILVSAVEHDSVLRAAEALIKDGFDVEYIPVSRECKVYPEAVESAIRDDTGLVSVMYVNNETGSVNPVEAIGEICARHNVLFHADCVQAAGCQPIDVTKIGCDFASISSHKIHGGKGVGALYVQDKSLLTPIIYGGSTQEFGLRAGTENVPGIVGFGRACEILMLCDKYNVTDDIEYISSLRRELFQLIQQGLASRGLPDILHINGDSDLSKNGKILNLRFDNIDAETLLLLLDIHGVCVSAGSACNSHEQMPSHVLLAMGISEEDARNSVRLSLSRMNTEDEIKEAAKIIVDCVILLWHQS